MEFLTIDRSVYDVLDIESNLIIMSVLPCADLEWFVNTFNAVTGEDLHQIYRDYLDSQSEIADEDISVNSTYDIPITNLYVTEKVPAPKKRLIDLDDVMTTSKPYDDDCC
ncbi:hypothetical protein PGB90_001591 [Kerria lacca]